MQPTTTGMAAMRAMVRIFGRDSAEFAARLVVTVIRLTNTARAQRSTASEATQS
jgi:hypothetical protein